jgi:hypothetical protein
LFLVVVIPAISGMASGVIPNTVNNLPAFVSMPSLAVVGDLGLANTYLQSAILNFLTGSLKTISDILVDLSDIFCLTDGQVQSTSVCNLTAVFTQVNAITTQVNIFSTTLSTAVTMLRTYALFYQMFNGI